MSPLSRRLLACLLLLGAATLILPADEAEAPRELVRTYPGHTEAVYSVAISPDGRQLLTGSFDRTVKLWDLASGKELRTFGGEKGHQNLVLTVAFAPDGHTFASGGSDNAVKVWDVPLAKALRELALTDAVTATAISPDGKSAAAGGKDGAIKVLNPVDGKESFALKGHVGAVTGLAYAPNNAQSLASVGIDGTLRFWNLTNGQPAAVIVAHPRPVQALAFAANGSAVYTAAEDGAVKFWQLPPAADKPLAGHTDTVRALAISADGNVIVTGSADKNVRVFGPDGGPATRTLPAPQPVTAVAISGTGANTITFAGTSTGQVLAFGGDGKPLFQGSAHGGEVTGIALSPGGTQFATAGADGNLAIWALPLLPTKTTPQPADVKAAVLSSDGKRIVTLNADNQVRVWTNGQTEKAFPVNAAVLALSADGSAFATAGADNIVRFQKRDGGKPAELPNQSGVVALAFHPNGTQLLTAHADGSLKLWPVPFPAKDAKPAWEAKLPGVKKVVFEPKGNQFYALGADKALHVGDAKTGKEQKAIPAHDAALAEFSLSADGTRAATASEDKTVKLWNLADGKELAKIALPAAATRLALSPRGDRVAVAYAQDGKTAVSVFDAASGRKLISPDERYTAVAALAFDPATRALMIAADKLVTAADVPVINVIPAHAGGVTGVAYHPNNSLFTGGKDKLVKQWDATTGKDTRSFGPLPEPVNAIALSRDGVQLAAAAGKQAKLWQAADGKELPSFTHPGEVISLAFNADRSRLVTGTTDNLARVWDLNKNYELQAFSHGAAVYGVAFPPNKPNAVVTASADKTAAIHAITMTRYVAASPAPIRSLAAVPNGSHLLLGGDDKLARLLNLGSGETERKFEGAAGAVLAVAVSRNGQLVAAAGADKIVRLYSYNDANLIGQFTAPAAVRSLSFNPTGTALLSGGDGNTATLWNVGFQPGNPPPPEFGKPVQSFEHPGPAPAVALSNDGITLITGGDDKLARVWKVAADAPTKNLQHPNLVDAVAYNKDGTLLATACHDGIVRVWDVAKGTPLKQINAHTMPQPSAVYAVAWSPDGKQLASASLDRSIKIWDATAGTLVKEIKGYDEKTAPKGHREAVFTVAWSPDGKQLASGSSDRTIKLWNAADASLVRDFVNPNLPSSPMQPPAAHPGWVYHLRYTPGGQIVSVGGAPRNRGYLALWNPADGKLLYGAELPLGPLYDVTVTPDGTQLVVACGPKSRQVPQADAALLKLPAK